MYKSIHPFLCDIYCLTIDGLNGQPTKKLSFKGPLLVIKKIGMSVSKNIYLVINKSTQTLYQTDLRTKTVLNPVTGHHKRSK